MWPLRKKKPATVVKKTYSYRFICHNCNSICEAKIPYGIKSNGFICTCYNCGCDNGL